MHTRSRASRILSRPCLGGREKGCAAVYAGHIILRAVCVCALRGAVK